MASNVICIRLASILLHLLQSYTIQIYYTRIWGAQQMHKLPIWLIYTLVNHQYMYKGYSSWSVYE